MKTKDRVSSGSRFRFGLVVVELEIVNGKIEIRYIEKPEHLVIKPESRKKAVDKTEKTL